MFLWVALGAGVTDADKILDLLAEHRVVVVPGELRSGCAGPADVPSDCCSLGLLECCGLGLEKF
jgi:DNA-binding transcriptional MocR family regulator